MWELAHYRYFFTEFLPFLFIGRVFIRLFFFQTRVKLWNGYAHHIRKKLLQRPRAKQFLVTKSRFTFSERELFGLQIGKLCEATFSHVYAASFARYANIGHSQKVNKEPQSLTEIAISSLCTNNCRQNNIPTTLFIYQGQTKANIWYFSFYHDSSRKWVRFLRFGIIFNLRDGMWIIIAVEV